MESLATIERHLGAGDMEALVGLYADGAEIVFDGPGVQQVLAGPIGLREGLERILAGGVRHELRLAGVAYGGGYVLDRCRDARTGAIVAWGGLTICRGLITRHTHAPAWDRVRGISA